MNIPENSDVKPIFSNVKMMIETRAYIGRYFAPPLMSPLVTIETIMDEHRAMVRSAERANPMNCSGVTESSEMLSGKFIAVFAVVPPSLAENEPKMTSS